MRKSRRITYEDRCQIYALSKRGASQESIAGVLGVSQSTVSREMCRNRGQRGYLFKQAEAKAQARQAIRSRPRKLTAPLRRKIEAKLRQMRWSPEQISGWLCEQGIKLSHERIYQMIWQDKRDGGDLWRSLRRNAGRGLIPNRIDISERPAIVARKARLGDWEGDTVVSAGHKGGLLTLVERKTQLAKIIKLPRATAHATQRAAVRRLKPIGDFVHTITFDNGKEFAAHQDIAHALKAKIFFATPYHAWERGLNENTNGLFRDFFTGNLNPRFRHGAERGKKMHPSAATARRSLPPQAERKKQARIILRSAEAAIASPESAAAARHEHHL
jgi:transposase, IS30 family